MIKEDNVSSNSYKIRQCTNADEQSAINVCLKTGDSGNDGTMYYNDSEILGRRYVSPYIKLSPELAFVLEDLNGDVCGYVLGALHSDEFYKRYIDVWLPKMKQMYPTMPLDEDTLKRDRHVIHDFHNYDFANVKLFDGYPSHLHIDLLPAAQGQGNGTKLIHHIEQELKLRGSTGVHLEMAANNDRAFRFYTKLGFNVLDKNQDVIWLGKKLI